ncbi:hypothetical protein A0128_00760 [Leptospira tipperaryensis]|uniref:Uncharacterized protein n=1 Tax=Leptospira tipperaryensis TaxID=2564040 RepID=A0A1D7USI5_9LEPT|nr:hypothetical protein [Leptospira tipperaryensis]AOP32535.1 hypothetical protein A0128_00760 [Leptospira tipperaryensis]
MRNQSKLFFLYRIKGKITSSLFLLCILLLLVVFSRSLQADTVILRNGIEYKNVKTVLGKSAVTIESEVGSIINIPINSIKSIKSIPVQWTNSSKNSLTPENENSTTENDLSKDSKTNSDKRQSALSNLDIAKRSIREALPSLIPGWSNLYLLGYPSLGALFSLTEFYLIHLISVYSKPTVHFYEDPVNLTLAYLNLDPNVSAQNPKFIGLVLSYENASLVKDPISGGYTTPEKIREGRERAATGLLSVLILDFSVTQAISMTRKRKESASKESGSFDIKFGSRFRPEVGESESKISLIYYF